jgi:hypothetical protein
MPGMSFPSDPSEFCITDVGSTTTKALLFLRQAGTWRSYRYETPTTVEKPHEDVTVGVLQSLRGLEKLTGRTLMRDDAGRPVSHKAVHERYPCRRGRG